MNKNPGLVLTFEVQPKENSLSIIERIEACFGQPDENDYLDKPIIEIPGTIELLNPKQIPFIQDGSIRKGKIYYMNQAILTPRAHRAKLYFGERVRIRGFCNDPDYVRVAPVDYPKKMPIRVPRTSLSESDPNERENNDKS